MSILTYTRYELTRTFRNRRLVVFSFGFPLVLYVLIAGPNRHEHDLAGSGISAPLYFMVALAAFGTMNSVLGSGGRIAVERTLGWTRQLRITPLPARRYFQVKIVTAYATALLTILMLYVAGAALGVSLSAGSWLAMTAMILVGLVPFAALGVLIGHLVPADSVSPVVGGVTALLALFGGVWYPITGGALHVIAQALPSFWLVQASRVGLGEGGWGVTGWLVVAGWTALAGVAAARAYRRDTERPAA
ncbi:MAG TPA: ABC transporter permease [Gaiellaceae bacterium]|nr:ABC transporter permease [Gaiellaceae bacterium]